jgi:hypothetical protein
LQQFIRAETENVKHALAHGMKSQVLAARCTMQRLFMQVSVGKTKNNTNSL